MLKTFTQSLSLESSLSTICSKANPDLFFQISHLQDINSLIKLIGTFQETNVYKRRDSEMQKNLELKKRIPRRMGHIFVLLGRFGLMHLVQRGSSIQYRSIYINQRSFDLAFVSSLYAKLGRKNLALTQQVSEKQQVLGVTEDMNEDLVQHNSLTIPSIWDCDMLSTMLLQEKSNLFPDHCLPLIKRSISFERRQSMVTWLSQVFDYLSLDSWQTLFLAINYMDRYCLHQVIHKDYYQLLAITSLGLACKMNEVTVPSFITLQKISKGAFSVEDIKKMEKVVLKVLEWKLDVVTPLMVCEAFTEIYVPASPESPNYSNHIKELLLLISKDVHFLDYPPSCIALSCMRLLLWQTKSNVDFQKGLLMIINENCDDMMKHEKCYYNLVSKSCKVCDEMDDIPLVNSISHANPLKHRKRQTRDSLTKSTSKRRKIMSEESNIYQ